MKEKKKTLRSKVYAVFTLSIVLSTLLTGIIFLAFYGRMVFENGTKNMGTILKSVGNNLEIKLEEVKNVVNIHYEQRDGEIIKGVLDVVNRGDADVVIFPMQGEENEAYYLGEEQSRFHIIPVEEYHGEQWFQQAVEADGEAVFYANHVQTYGSEKKEVYSCLRVLKDEETKENNAVIKVDVDVKHLQKIVEIIDTEINDNIIISRDSKVLAASRRIKHLKEKDFDDGIKIINRSLYYVKTVPIEDSDWELTYMLSMKSSVEEYLRVLFLTCLEMMGTVVIAIVIYRRNSREIVNDLEQITDVFQEIGKGNMDVSVNVKQGTELYAVAQTINGTIESLKNYIEKEYVWRIRQKEAQYKMLQSQVNPHFLYNTLNGFIALNRMGEKKKLEKSIMNLAQLFRYSSSMENITTIEEECNIEKDYLDLEKLKYEERVEYEIYLEDACKKRKIPKLLLQPIVENSIVHGMGDTDKPIMITTSICSVDIKGIGTMTVILISDNGMGFDMEKISKEEEHSGIENVKNRAKIFDREMFFQCTSKVGEGTETIFVFQDREAENENGA